MELTQPDYTKNGKYRWWKGAATGIAAGIKLTPLIFVPYLLVTRKWREAAGCAGSPPADRVHPAGAVPSFLASVLAVILGITAACLLERATCHVGRDSDDRADRAAGLPDRWDHHWVWIALAVAVAGRYAINAARSRAKRPPGGSRWRSPG